MEETTYSSIADCIKAIIPIKEVSSKLSISRPTMYRYMDCYDRQEYDSIRGPVLDFFDLVSSGDVTYDGVSAYLDQITADNDDSEDDRKKEAAVVYEVELEEIMSSLDLARSRYDVAQDLYNKTISATAGSVDENLAKTLRENLYNAEKELVTLQNRLESTRCRYASFRVNAGDIRRRNTALRESRPRWSNDDIRTLNFGLDGKSMVIFQTTKDVDSTIVRVLTRDGNDLVPVGDYVPQLGKNHVLIDDLIPRIQFMYIVIQNTEDGLIETGPRPLSFR